MTSGEIATILWQDNGIHELSITHDGRPVRIWIPCTSWRAFARMLSANECRFSAVPRTDQQRWATAHAPVLWAVLNGSEAEQRLQRFQPAPTIVIREGKAKTRTALWALWRPLRGAYIERATERLSYALRGVRKAAGVEALLPSPFSGRNYVEFESNQIYTARQVVGDLKDA